MRKISLAGFKDPVRRPRYIIWTGVVLLVLVPVMVVVLGASSSRWFCAQACHKVQDDLIRAYESGVHSEISCLACHEPVNADPVTFMLLKTKALKELYEAVTNTYHFPLNPGSALALNEEEMPASQCTQCHSKNRVVTPPSGILINHKKHEDKEIWCTVCHNRVAHPETSLTLELKTPSDGKPNVKHPDFTKMTACFRCHDLEGKKDAPGACPTCHTADFALKPPSHLENEFFPKGHAELARADLETVKEGAAEAEKLIEEGVPKKMAEPVSYCSTCHIKSQFCQGCHGLDIPHSEEFKTKSHPQAVKTVFAKCVMCHAPGTKGTPRVADMAFCNNCHHGTKVDWTFDKAVPWRSQHPKAVSKNGVDACFVTCHKPEFCYACHSKERPFPTSHRSATWKKPKNIDPRSGDRAGHAKAATADVKVCEICHGKGAPNVPFCKACHKVPIPHSDQFKQFHAKTGRSDPRVCANCHRWRELCSNCHHEGSSLTTPWTSVHGKIVTANGSAACFVKCHKKDTCVACHNKRKVIPSSHRARNWRNRTSLNTKAQHPVVFAKYAEVCTYCHGDGGTSAKFCMSCHKLAMPHPADWKDVHKAQFQAKKVTKPVCMNCHVQQFCDGCHHTYTSTAVTWRKYHQQVVKRDGPAKCFDKCHAETFCSHCHVRLIH